MIQGNFRPCKDIVISFARSILTRVTAQASNCFFVRFVMALIFQPANLSTPHI